MLSALAKTGIFSLTEHLEHNMAYTVTSIGCFVAALLLPYAAAQGMLSVATAAMLAKAALSVTYFLSGLPQLAETVYAAVAGKIDTHVLMSLSVLGTLYMGMAQEVSRGCAELCCVVLCFLRCYGLNCARCLCYHVPARVATLRWHAPSCIRTPQLICTAGHPDLLHLRPNSCKAYDPYDCLGCCCVCWHFLQGALLLLLFRCSHQLEHRLTDKAAGGLQRLFDSVPDRAVVVEVEQGSNAPKVATSQGVRAGNLGLDHWA